MTKPFLVTYDYGQGAVWANLYARSKDEIEREFPELAVHEDPPEWMREYVSSTGGLMTLDIQDKDTGFLAAIVQGRRSQE
jgi:hypothetical protein